MKFNECFNECYAKIVDSRFTYYFVIENERTGERFQRITRDCNRAEEFLVQFGNSDHLRIVAASALFREWEDEE